MTRHDASDQRIIALLRELPGPPPPGVARFVTARLAPHRLSSMARLRRFLRTPMTFRATPLAAASALALLLLLGAGAFQLMGPRPMSAPDTPGTPLAEGFVPVELKLHDPRAHSVSVIGSFNGWSPTAGHMRLDPSSGTWEAHLELAPGNHEYVFLVDGRRVVTDPGALFTTSDGFGNKNAVLIVGRQDARDL